MGLLFEAVVVATTTSFMVVIVCDAPAVAEVEDLTLEVPSGDNGQFLIANKWSLHASVGVEMNGQHCFFSQIGALESVGEKELTYLKSFIDVTAHF